MHTAQSPESPPVKMKKTCGRKSKATTSGNLQANHVPVFLPSLRVQWAIQSGFHPSGHPFRPPKQNSSAITDGRDDLIRVEIPPLQKNTKTMKNIAFTITALALVLIHISPVTATAQRPAEPTIVGIASADPENFSTLVAAVVKADLVGTLDGRRQFTVFAPTNDAFDAAAEVVLGENFTGLDLVDVLDTETLQEILLYHVSPGARPSQSILPAQRIRTVSGDFLFVDGLTLVGNESSANLVPSLIDIPARNGIIHVIDFVLLP